MSDYHQPGPGQQPPSGPPPAGWAGYGTPPQYGAPPQWGYAPVPTPGGPPGTYFDQTTGLWIPEGTTLASAGRRIGAWFLGALLVIVTLVIGYLIWSLVVWGRGQTPKYQVLGMRCYKPQEGRVAGFGDMVLREVVGYYLIDWITSRVADLVSFILVLVRGDRKTLADMVAGTVVLHDPNKVLAPRG